MTLCELFLASQICSFILFSPVKQIAMGLLYWLLVFVGSPAAILADPIAIVSAVIFIYSTDRANKLKGGGHQISQNALIKFTAIFGIMKIILMYYIAPQHSK